MTSERPACSPDAGSRALLEVRQLRIAFPAGSAVVHPVREVSLQVARGQRVGIIGESGCGKSLTALAILRLIRPPGRVVAGEILLDGRSLLDLGPSEMARVRGGEIGMVYQSPMTSLNPLQRVGAQIVEAIRVHEDVTRRAARMQAVDLLREVGIPEPERRVDSYPHEFSGGMKQRVMIAMAISANPRLLLADEPTTALDVTTQARVLELLGRLAQDREMAVVFITHDLGAAARLCEDIKVMYAGRIVEEARAGQFYGHPTHPYSEALMQSVVRRGISIDEPIPAIPGRPPLPGHIPAGCSFHPRCPYAAEICRTVEPPRIRVGGDKGVFAECHFAPERYRRVGGAAP